MCVVDLIFILISRTLQDVTNLFKHKPVPTSHLKLWGLHSSLTLHPTTSAPFPAPAMTTMWLRCWICLPTPTPHPWFLTCHHFLTSWSPILPQVFRGCPFSGPTLALLLSQSLYLHVHGLCSSGLSLLCTDSMAFYGPHTHRCIDDLVPPYSSYPPLTLHLGLPWVPPAWSPPHLFPKSLLPGEIHPNPSATPLLWDKISCLHSLPGPPRPLSAFMQLCLQLQLTFRWSSAPPSSGLVLGLQSPSTESEMSLSPV